MTIGHRYADAGHQLDTSLSSRPVGIDMSEDDLSRLIEDIGDRFDLSAYEIEAYLTILERGSITASALADRTSIPQPRIYDTVRSLNDRGLVELHESRPMSVVAIDPTDAFGGMSRVLDDLVTQLERRYTAPGPDRQAVSLVKSRSTILRHVGEVIDRSEYDLALSLTPELLARYESQLREARQRGVSTELLLAPAEIALDANRFPYTEVATSVRARRGITTPIIAVADGEHSIYATQDAIQGDADRYGVIFNRSELGFLVFGFFGTVLWSTADPIVEADGQLTLPRRYASIRRCIKDLQPHEGPFLVTIEGRWVDTGEPCRVTGMIVDISIRATAEVASMTIETDETQLTIGGRLAAYEDVEAHEIVVDHATASR